MVKTFDDFDYQWYINILNEFMHHKHYFMHHYQYFSNQHINDHINGKVIISYLITWHDRVE